MPTPWENAGPKPWPEPETKQNLQRAAVYLLTHSDKPRAWGEIDSPPPSLHTKDIELGVGLEGVPACRLYLGMKEDTVHFVNPRPKLVACYELTDEGERWAEALLADYERGFKSWLLNWQ